MWYLHLLDGFFLIFHFVFILFNLFGWLSRKWRKWNLATLFITGLSWVGLGIFYGWGYCPLTDWHWQVLHALDRPPAESSYIQYLIHRVLPLKVSATFADTLTLTLYIMALITSLIMNTFKVKTSHQAKEKR